MDIKTGEYKSLVDYIRNKLKVYKWIRIIIKIEFHNSGSYGASVSYFEDEKEMKYITDNFEIDPILIGIFKKYRQGIVKRNFNKVFITIKEEDYFVSYEMDEEKIKNEKQKSSLIFPNYLYERMRTQIYDYELDNNLLIPVYNDRFEVYDYKVSWDSGLFTFIVDEKSKQIYFEIEVSFHGEKRVIPLELIDSYKKSIWYHYELTHGELKEFWKPWNKMVVTAPENFIPLGKDQEYIQYSLVEVDKEEIVINTQIINTLQFETANGSVLNYAQINRIWESRNYPTKLTWKYQDNEIIIEDKGQYFFFEVYKDRIVVLYHGRWSNSKKHPNNLLIYHADGSLMKIVEAPRFKSKKMIEGVKSEYDQEHSNGKTIWIVPPHFKEIKNMWGKVKRIEVMQGFMDGLRKKNGKLAVTLSDSSYFEAIIKNYENAGFSELAEELQFALDGGLVDYFKIKQGFKSDGTLKATEISKFDIN
ncbi:hypothetical protein ACQY1Q_02065 [Tenacibaculum sp. TC6]|uniref:hypothetical protein n=1 Tax=Tenacibaculum sp. TC6 TaxID=3423223 RepID=UPI003D35AA38